LVPGRIQMHYLFQPPPVPSLAVAGRPERLPVRRIFGVGRNYEEHAKEMGQQVDRETPFYFLKDSSTLVHSGATIPYPPGTENFHFEMEMVAIMGKEAFRIPKGDALDCVFGYACGLDMTRRDLQLRERAKQRPWDLGKNFENGAVLTEIVEARKIGHPRKGRIELRQNGELRQSGDIAGLVWAVPELIEHLSRYYHLRPGDLIMTGTPAGVGPVRSGDRLEGLIEGLGSITLSIAAAE
jgi:fumarylpyruvate hydrolase